MEITVNAISVGVLILLEIILFYVLVQNVFPKFLNVRCSVGKSRSRGLQKYLYPEGRGVAYEPSVKFRKYIDRYILFTNDGYKYLKCRLVGDVKKIEYSVIMFNRKNNVIDVIEVTETTPFKGETGVVTLHHETSYVDIVVNSVNGDTVTRDKLLRLSIVGVLAYTVLVFLLSFGELCFIYGMINLYLYWFGLGDYMLVLDVVKFLVPSAIIGIVTGFFAYLSNRVKGVRLSL